VDSSVAAALVHKAIGDQQVAVFVDTGLLRQGEPEQVVKTFREQMGAELVAVQAEAEFFAALQGVTDPEQKRKIVGEKFIRIFEQAAKSLDFPPRVLSGNRDYSAGTGTNPPRAGAGTTRGSWCKARFTRMWSNRLPRTAIKLPGSRATTM